MLGIYNRSLWFWVYYSWNMVASWSWNVVNAPNNWYPQWLVVWFLFKDAVYMYLESKRKYYNIVLTCISYLRVTPSFWRFGFQTISGFSSDCTPTEIQWLYKRLRTDRFCWTCDLYFEYWPETNCVYIFEARCMSNTCDIKHVWHCKVIKLVKCLICLNTCVIRVIMWV